MSFNFLLLSQLEGVNSLNVITYLDDFNKIVTYFFDGVGLKLALLSGIVNVLKYIITADDNKHVSRLKVISEGLIVSIIMYALSYVLVQNNAPIYSRYLVAIVIGVLGYSVIERIIRVFVSSFIHKYLNTNPISNRNNNLSSNTNTNTNNKKQ